MPHKFGNIWSRPCVTKFGLPRIEEYFFVVGFSAPLATPAEVTSMTPSVTPNRAGVRIYRRSRIHSRCHIDRIIINHDCRRHHDDRCELLFDNDRWRRSVLIGRNFTITRHLEISGHCPRQALVHLLHPRAFYASMLFLCLSPFSEQTQEDLVRSMNFSLGRIGRPALARSSFRTANRAGHARQKDGHGHVIAYRCQPPIRRSRYRSWVATEAGTVRRLS
jgi:hypothetical protein